MDENPFKKLKEKQERIQSEIKKRKELEKKTSAEGKKLIRIAFNSAYLKDYFKSSINEMQYYAELFFQEIANRFKSTPEALKDLSPVEMHQLIMGKTIDWKKIRERAHYHIIFSDAKQFVILLGKEANDLETTYLQLENKNQTEFNGRSACKGKATGVARIILGPQDFHKFQKGDILVAINTSPDFVPLMQKAAAIIAEEGGLTSHVSVVSREMNIPSVVGVHHITQILKDGQKLEVDANKGIVRKVNTQ